MDLKQMQYVLAVAEQLNFSRAAEMLYVTQPLLSQKVAELEQELGVKLFNRSRRAVELTAAGKVFVQKARTILDEVGTVAPAVQRAQAGLGTEYHLSIGYEEVFERTRLTQGLLKLHMDHPNCFGQLKSYTLGQITNALQERELDLAFIMLPNQKLDAELAIRELDDDNLCLVVSKKLMEGRDQTQLEQFLLMFESLPMFLLDQDQRGMISILELCMELCIQPALHFYEDVQSVLMNVEAGGGVTILPSKVVSTFGSPYLCSYRLEGYEHSKLQRAACWLKGNLNPAISIFLRCLEEG